ncbi:MAG TPA: thioredoxin [Fluviicola sp.]|nr:thioredoxin [Fluviicola sp.]
MATFGTIIKGEKPVLVDFYADWCGPCQVMMPELEKLKALVGDTVVVLKVNVDRNPEAAARYGVRGVPTLLLFQNGTIRWRQSGAHSAAQLQQIIQTHLIS